MVDTLNLLKKFEFLDFEWRLKPNFTSESFFISLGIGHIQSLVILKDSDYLNNSLSSIRQHLTSLLSSYPNKATKQEIDLYINMMHIVTNENKLNGLHYIEYYYKNNTDNCIDSMISSLKLISSQHSSMNNFVITEDFLTEISNKLKISVSVYEENGHILMSKNCCWYPAVYLYKENEQGQECFSILYHKEFMKYYKISKNAPHQHPFISCYQFFKQPKLSSDLVELIVKISEVYVDIDLSDKNIKELKKAYEESNLNIDEIEEIFVKHEKKTKSYEILDKIQSKCDTCCEHLLSTYPINFNCSHLTCVKCRVLSFRKDYSSYCSCKREYLDQELALLTSFAEDY